MTFSNNQRSTVVVGSNILPTGTCVSVSLWRLV